MRWSTEHSSRSRVGFIADSPDSILAVQHDYAGSHFTRLGYNRCVQSKPNQKFYCMKKITCLTLAAVALASAPLAQAQLSITAMSTFSPNNDGWWAPAEGAYAHLEAASDRQRGLAYGNGELYLVSRAVATTSVRRLNSTTGVEVGNLNVTGVTSVGTFGLNKIGVADDGVIYAANLVTAAASPGSPYRVYSWATPASSPVTNYSGAPLAAVRTGDSFSVSGSGSSTRTSTGFQITSTSAAAGSAGTNGYAIIDPTAGTGTAVSFAGTPPLGGDFRLGLTFGPGGQVWGNQGSLALRETSYSGSTGTLLGTATGLISTAERPMDFATVNGLNILATASTGDGTVRVYDASNPLALILLGTKNNILGAANANINAAGDVAFGAQTDNGDGTTTVQLYALVTNNGIQAFNVVVPEPATGALVGVGLSALVAFRRSRK